MPRGEARTAPDEFTASVLIVNVGDYVGESTRREIEHARSRGVPVSYLEPHVPDCHAEN